MLVDAEWLDRQNRKLARNLLKAKLPRIDLLVLDDWGLVPAGDAERRDLLEIIEDRYGNRSTILTGQLPSKSWHDHIGDPTIADAI